MPDIKSATSTTSTTPPPPNKHGVIIITAKGIAPATTYRFPDQFSPDLIKNLKDLGLQSTGDYEGLYQNNQLSRQRIVELHEKPAPDVIEKRQCTATDPQNPGFPDLAHPEKRFDRLLTQLAKKAEKGDFRYRDDEHHEADLQGVPDDIKALRAKVEDNLHTLEAINLENENRGERDKSIKPADAKDYINGLLKDGLKLVAAEAERTGIVFHQPHHDLTPGILWLDEIFRVLVSQVARIVDEINAATKQTGQLNLGPLETFVKKLGGDDGGNDFAPLIYPGGTKVPGIDEIVDPTRVELFMTDNYIDCAAVIVGAWQGGTHSAGHT